MTCSTCIFGEIKYSRFGWLAGKAFTVQPVSLSSSSSSLISLRSVSIINSLIVVIVCVCVCVCVLDHHSSTADKFSSNVVGQLLCTERRRRRKQRTQNKNSGGSLAKLKPPTTSVRAFSTKFSPLPSSSFPFQ